MPLCPSSIDSDEIGVMSLPAHHIARRRLQVAGIFVLSLLCLTQCTLAHADTKIKSSAGTRTGTPIDACDNSNSPQAVKEAMRGVCEDAPLNAEPVHKAIIICFLGGFVKPGDTRHPEVWFAKYLRDRYGSSVQVWVFSNHDEESAVSKTMQFLDSSRMEIERPSIIVYGHSWGGSQVLTFARDMAERDVPVSLTIQIDSVRKLGQDGHTVPRNVSKAINFYQTRGLTPGERHIVPADPARTSVLGNLHMSYHDLRVDCSNYKWLSRVFNKPHHQIENDPRVWSRMAALIVSELTAKP